MRPKRRVASPYRTYQAGKLWTHSSQDWGFAETARDDFAPAYPQRQGDARWGRRGWTPERCGSLKVRKRHNCPATRTWRKFLDSLEKRGLRDDTLVVFFADKGFNSTILFDPFDPETNRYAPSDAS